MAVEDDSLILPPGFRFHPTDEEIITHYLSPKVLNQGFIARAMGEVDLNKCEPWDLPSKAKMGEKEWYFFCQRDRKYPTGMRTNRATESGYWKATGKDKEIYRGRVLVGMKKTLVFYRGRAPKGEKTNWVMHEYRLEGKATLSNLPKSAKEEWVVCRVFHKNTGMKRSPMHRVLLTSFTEELLDSPRLPPLMDSSGNYLFNSGEDCYFSSSGVLDNSNLFMNNNPSSSSSYLHQIHAEDNYINNNQYFSVPGDVGCYLQQDQPQVMMLQPATIPAIRRHCKAEQFSNQSMLSQDTGVSNDRNTEISSVVSKRDASFDHQEFDVPPAAAGGVLDLRGMWRC